jgi:TfoX/Sxy family transcriptional regulator of competence genes
MKWQKSPPELEALFARTVPSDPRVEHRKMFGYPCAFVNGNMFAGLHEQNLVLRLPDALRDELFAAGATPFTPLGRTMREYVAVSAAMRADDVLLAGWLARSFAYVSSLEPKPDKASKTAKAEKAPQSPKKARSTAS